MPPYLQVIPSLIFLFLCSYVTWSWIAWFRSRGPVQPIWRTTALVFGLCFASVSTVLSAWLFIHAAFTGGYPFYHPIELFCIRVGTFTGLLGLVMAVAGKG